HDVAEGELAGGERRGRLLLRVGGGHGDGGGDVGDDWGDGHGGLQRGDAGDLGGQAGVAGWRAELAGPGHGAAGPDDAGGQQRLRPEERRVGQSYDADGRDEYRP